METKAHIRQKALAFRNHMPEEERRQKSGRIAERVSKTLWFQEADVLLVYMAFRSEADTEELISGAFLEGKAVYCPKVEGEEMNFYRIASKEDLKEGYQGIKEPEGKPEDLFLPADGMKCLMIVPGSAFDKEGNRIGYGKGYYDKYLERYPEIRTMGICFEGQMQEKIPEEGHDRRMNRVITEKGMY